MIVCSMYSRNAVLPSPNEVGARAMCTIIGWLSRTDEDEGTTKVVMGGRTGGSMVALH